MDPLSDILALVKADSVMTGGIVAGGAWAVRFRPPPVLKLYAVARGTCSLRLDRARRALALRAGDVVMLTEPRSYVIASDLAAPPRDASTLRSGPDRFVKLGRGDDFELLAGKVELDPARGKLLVDVLPGVLLLRSPSAEAGAAFASFTQLVAELRAPRPGGSLVVRMHAQLLLVELLRAELRGRGPRASGWLRALGDARLAPALRRMHDAPGRAWQLAELAAAAGMSRSTFAERFKAGAGVAPLAYLTRWRMRLAEAALVETDATVGQLAGRLGYGSESAFSTAFKREIGLSPQQFRRRAKVTP